MHNKKINNMQFKTLAESPSKIKKLLDEFNPNKGKKKKKPEGSLASEDREKMTFHCRLKISHLLKN